MQDFCCIETKYGPIYIDSERDKKMATALQRGEYPHEVLLEVARSFVRNGDTVIDIGAHVGTFAIPIAAVAGKTIVFEPSPENAALLSRNATENKVALQIVNKALGREAGKGRLVVRNASNSGANTLMSGGDIPIVMLDNEIEHADFIKMDVEGMELEVLLGGSKLIHRSRPVVLFEVNLSQLRAHGVSPRALERFFTKRGYRIFVPLEGKNIELARVRSATFLTALIAPYAWLFFKESAPFDLVAVPKERPLSIKNSSFMSAIIYMIKNNFLLKVRRLRFLFYTGAYMVKSVLTFRASSIGDCLMGKYLLENIRAARPGARCSLAVSSRTAMVRDLFAAYPWIEVLEVNKNPLSLARFFARGQQDIVVTPYTGGVFGILPKLTARLSAKKLIGYSDSSPFNRFLYTKLIPLVGRSRAPRLLECDVLAAAGIPVAVTQSSFEYLPQPQLLPRLGLQEKNYVVLHLFSGGNARGLSPDKKMELINALAKTLLMPLVLTGTEKETMSLGALPLSVRVVHTTLQELAHLIDHAAGMVSLDTGAAHIAAHLRKPLVVLASCVGVQWWSKDMYGEGMPTKLFTRLDVCKEGHDYSGYAPCLDAIDMDAVAAAAAMI